MEKCRMGVLIVVLIIVAAVGGVVWTHACASEARAGVGFDLPASPDLVVDAINRAFCAGATAKAKGMFSTASATQQSAYRFQTTTRLGDVGHITVRPGGTGSRVEAAIDQLFVGAKTMGGNQGLWGLSKAIVNGLYEMLRITPSAGKLDRFQKRIEGRLHKQLAKSSV